MVEEPHRMETAVCDSECGQTPDLADVAVIIPNWNESDSLPTVLRKLPAAGQVIAVSRTPHLTREAEASRAAGVVSEPRTGYGAACLRGLSVVQDRVALGETPPEVVVFLDADYVKQAELLEQFARPILHGEADFVLGSRRLETRTRRTFPRHIAWSSRLACFLMRQFFGAEYTDLGPIRAIDYYALKSLDMSDRNFGWSMEMQIKAVRAKLRTREVPVSTSAPAPRGRIREVIKGAINVGRIVYTLAKYRLLGRTRLSTARK